MTAAEFQSAVSGLGESLGLEMRHVRNVRREHPAWMGFPDLLMFGPAGIMFRELS